MILLIMIIALPDWDLTKYEIYNHNYARFYELPNHHLLLQSKLENKLLVIDKNGEIVAKLGTQGDGPGELNQPVVLGVMPDYFIVGMQDNRVVAFDFNLRLLADKDFRKLPVNTTMAMYFGERFFFQSFGMQGFSVSEVELIGFHWEERRKLFPVKYDGYRPDFFFGFQSGVMFKRYLFLQEEYYRTEVFDFPFKEEPVMILEQTIDTLRNAQNERVYLPNSFRSKDKYYILITLANSKFQPTSNWLDIFKINGDFERRVSVPNDFGIDSILNTNQVLIYSGDDMLYWRIESYLTDLP